MGRTLLYGAIACIAVVAIFFVIQASIYNDTQEVISDGHKNATYGINGQQVALSGGVHEVSSAPDSASKTITRYFGNEARADINQDGKEDVIFLLTQETGGTATMYYVVAAISTDVGYVGSEGWLLGDRIAPQGTVIDVDNVVVVTYAERRPTEDFSVSPSIGKSVKLKLDFQSRTFDEVVD